MKRQKPPFFKKDGFWNRGFARRSRHIARYGCPGCHISKPTKGGRMNTWMTTIGQSPFAAVNTLWAALREEQVMPIGKLQLFYSEDMKSNLLIFTSWAEILFSEYQKTQPRLQAIEYPANDIKAFRKQLKQTISKPVLKFSWISLRVAKPCPRLCC